VSAFDPQLWAEVPDLGGTPPEHPGQLDRETLAALAAELRDRGWSYGDIALALGVPKTTIYRWTGQSVEAGNSDGEPRTSPGWILAGVALALAILSFRRSPGGSGPIRGGPR
jgi:hypothetical protein